MDPRDPSVFYRDPARSREELRRLGREAIEAALDYLYEQAMRRPVGPETYAEARRRILPHSMNAAHPRAFCARGRSLLDRHADGALRRARLYASEQAHFSLERSLDVLGGPFGPSGTQNTRRRYSKHLAS